MKVKPFYISTAVLNEKEVGLAIDKCVKSGADAYEGVSTYHGDCYFHGGLMTFDIWKFFGVNESNGTVFEDDPESFGGDAQEITLDQLDEWLGINQTETPEEKEALDMIDATSKQVDSLLAKGGVVEWKSGDECVINRKALSGEVLSDTGTYYAETDTHYWLHGIGCRDNKDVSGNIYSKKKYWLSKPETPEQKAERERREEAEEMIQCLLDNYVACEESAIDYVLEYLHECDYRKAK